MQAAIRTMSENASGLVKNHRQTRYKLQHHIDPEFTNNYQINIVFRFLCLKMKMRQDSCSYLFFYMNFWF